MPGVPDYFGQSAQIGPQDAANMAPSIMPSQPSQAVQPLAVGIPQAAAPDPAAFYNDASTAVQNIPGQAESQQIQKQLNAKYLKLTKSQSELAKSRADGQELMSGQSPQDDYTEQTINRQLQGALAEYANMKAPTPGWHNLLPGHTSFQENRAYNSQREAAKDHIESLKKMSEILDAHDKNALSLLGENWKNVQSVQAAQRDMQNQEAKQQQIEQAQQRLTQQQLVEIHREASRQVTRAIGMEALNLARETDPTKKQMGIQRLQQLTTMNEYLPSILSGKADMAGLAPFLATINALSGAGQASGTDQTSLQNPLVGGAMQKLAPRLSVTGNAGTGGLSRGFAPAPKVPTGTKIEPGQVDTKAGKLNVPPPDAPSILPMQLSTTPSAKATQAAETGAATTEAKHATTQHSTLESVEKLQKIQSKTALRAQMEFPGVAPAQALKSYFAAHPGSEDMYHGRMPGQPDTNHGGAHGVQVRDRSYWDAHEQEFNALPLEQQRSIARQLTGK